MNFPVTISIGETQILAHLIFEVLATFLGFRLYIWLRKPEKDQITNLNRTWIIVGAIVGAILGSRLVGSLENPEWFISKFQEGDFLYYYQSKTILGGLLGGLWAVELTKKIIGERSSSGDLFVFPLILAMIIGRIGCLSMGIYEPTYGNETDFFLAMDLGDGKMRHPTALYEILFLLSSATLLFIIKNNYVLQSGRLFQLFMITYLWYRLLINFIQPAYKTPIFGLSVLQLTALLGLLYYAVILVQERIVKNI